jgi:hypothetical protein
VCDNILPQQEIEFEARLSTNTSIRPVFQATTSDPLSDELSAKSMFSITGQPIDSPRKGLVIVNGQKILFE